jgi:hypothetical protein
VDWNRLFITVIQLAIFSVFITSIIEVVKGISAIGLLGLVKGLWGALVNNKDLKSESFPVLSFAIALFCCWAFDVGIMKLIIMSISGNLLHQPWAGCIDYFGTASVTYLGSDQLFKRFLNVERQATTVLTEIKQTSSSITEASK